MPPSIHIVRHAQSMTNVSLDFDHHDPELTELGHQQSTALAEQFKKLGKIDLVLASPMQRTIQTALNAFPDYNNKIVLIPDLQEYGTTPSDTGSSPDILLEKYGDARLDYSFVTPDWTDKGPHTRYAPRFVAIRARSARIFIRSIAQRFRDTDANIVVVSHATFIGYLTKGDENLFLNAEYRTYYFDPIHH
ncbi:hypothetical protein NUW58_g10208 [Xylaria curta]|uniref:Uncharacterized protein n=1 Tax=Xylaria curta TaxID=42375 RepID=A0ACC1MPF5_9PEZI|nr:hypothetical protein NUW58_g10208 [Xylaria curta]